MYIKEKGWGRRKEERTNNKITNTKMPKKGRVGREKKTEKKKKEKSFSSKKKKKEKKIEKENCHYFYLAKGVNVLA